MRREQNVPLSRQAGGIEMEHWSEIDAVKLRFQSLVSARKLPSENAFNMVLRRLR